MSYRTSYSKNNCYKMCPKFWDFSYNKKLKSPIEGASLYFGSAVDAAVTDMLKGKTDYMTKFKDRWEVAIVNNDLYKIFDNDNIAYANGDFDQYVLDAQSKTTLYNWAKELKVDGLGKDGISVYKAVSKIKKDRYKKIKPEEMKYFNRASWISLKRKGELLIEAFKNQFYPKVKKVVAVQQFARYEDPLNRFNIIGFIDMVLEIEGYDKPIIFDLKTASRPYTNEQVELTDQLAMYSGMKGQEYGTDLVGYIVLSKSIPKDVSHYCKVCNFKRTGKHRKCNNTVNSDRCNGEWKEFKVPKPEVQVLVEQKTQDQIDDMFLDVTNLAVAMDNKIIYKNKDKCYNWYGSKCPYFDACHKNDETGLIKK